MDARQLKSLLTANLKEQSGLDLHRNYLGMSSIGHCPRQLYRRFLDGLGNVDDRHYWRSWLGYTYEAAVVRLLGDLVGAAPTELVANFDSRYRGHVDCQTANGQLVEIKSVEWPKFARILREGPPATHVDQVQAYMRHGPWKRTLLLYVSRDVPWREFRGLPIWVFDVLYDERAAGHLDDKARAILAAIDAREPPGCECGHC